MHQQEIPAFLGCRSALRPFLVASVQKMNDWCQEKNEKTALMMSEEESGRRKDVYPGKITFIQTVLCSNNTNTGRNNKNTHFIITQ